MARKPATKTRKAATQKKSDSTSVVANWSDGNPPKPLVIVRRYAHGMGGPPVERGPRLVAMLENIDRQINDADDPHAALIAAIGVWIGYPIILEHIGHGWRTDAVLTQAYDELNFVHLAATKLLLKRAEQLEIPSAPMIWTASEICQSLFRSEPWNYYVGPYDTWPECLGDKLRELPEDERTAIRAGHAAIAQMNARLDMGATNTAVEALLPAPAPPPPHPDGPEQPDTFWWQGKPYDGLTTIKHSLLELLWTKRKVDLDDARDAVWYGKDVSDQRIRNTASELGNWFNAKSLPITVSSKQSHIRLEIHPETFPE